MSKSRSYLRVYREPSVIEDIRNNDFFKTFDKDKKEFIVRKVTEIINNKISVRKSISPDVKDIFKLNDVINSFESVRYEIDDAGVKLTKIKKNSVYLRINFKFYINSYLNDRITDFFNVLDKIIDIKISFKDEKYTKAFILQEYPLDQIPGYCFYKANVDVVVLEKLENFIKRQFSFIYEDLKNDEIINEIRHLPEEDFINLYDMYYTDGKSKEELIKYYNNLKQVKERYNI